MRVKRAVWITTLAIGVVAMAAVCMWPQPEPLSFLKEQPMKLLWRVEAPTPGPNGQYPIEQIYATDKSVEDVTRWIEGEATTRGFKRTSHGWTDDEGSFTLEVASTRPTRLSDPGPAGTKAYLVTLEEQPNSLLNQAYHRAKRKIRDRTGSEPDNLPRDL